MRLLRRVLLPFLFVVAVVARAQSVHWENDDNNPGTAVLLVFTDCSPDGDPQLPAIPNASLALIGQSQQTNIVNTSISVSITLQYSVQARRGGPLQIPAFTVKTNKGPIRVAAFNGAAPAVTPESVASAKLAPDKTSVWAGEVFRLDYELTVAEQYNPHPNPTFDWSAGSLVTEDWSKYQVSEDVVNGQRQAKLSYHTRAYAKAPGALKLEPASQLVQVQTGTSTFGFFSQPRMEPVSVTSNQPTLEVKPLPPGPSTFTGAVGHFKLTSKVVPGEASVGDPVTWTLELSGTGNWPDIAGLPAREVSKDFQVIQPKAKRTNSDGKLFDATLTEDVVLVPTKAGRYTLGPVAFSFFNPDTGAYETLRTEQVTVTIKPPATAPANATTSANTIGGTAAPAPEMNASHPAPTSPNAPAAIPRDPLPGHGDASLPLTLKALIGWIVTPFIGLVVFWLVLACRRAAKTDPLRAQREAAARLQAVIPEIRAAAAAQPQDAASSQAALAAHLLQWQRDTAILFRLPQAAPNPDALSDPEWSSLWRDADRTLYGANAPLPSDWVDRALSALVAKKVPGFNPARLFLPKNLLAFAAALMVLLAIGRSRVEAAAPTPDAAYRAGEFAKAEAAWRDALAQRPTDWIAHHNLALALAQQDKPAESAAQAIAAFVQRPNDAVVRWDFTYATDKAGFAPEPLHEFLREGPVTAIATLASPAAWQRLLIVAAFAVAIAIGWLLFNAYGRRARWQTWSALILAAAATLLGFTSIFGVVAYGATADARAVVTWQAGVLRSIPTEADTTQKTTTLAPGSVAIVDKTFLGNWDHLVFENGQTGWVRKETVVPLWR